MVAPLATVVAAVARLTDQNGMNISIIIPTYNDAAVLQSTLSRLLEQINPAQTEIIISDGGSQDKTTDLVEKYHCMLVESPTGRAMQMNRGAQQAQGEWLVFLHADSQLPDDWQTSVTYSRRWGFFPLRLSGKQSILRIIERSICLRSSLTAVATGDQAMFFQRDFFNQINGFDNIPIMEDIAISKKARRLSKPDIAAKTIVTSSRRWEQNGIIKTVLLMWWLRLAYWVGTSPERLHRIYYPDHC